MAANAYQLWLKKREFKSPRVPPGPAPLSSDTSCPPVPKMTAGNSSKQSQDTQDPSKSISAKFHAVSGVETTHVAVQSVSRPSALKKRPRSWLSGLRQAAGGHDEQDRTTQEVKVAGRTNVAGYADKVAGLKRRRSGKEDVMEATKLKLASGAKVLRQSSSKRDSERAVWSGRVEEEKKPVCRGEDDDVKPAARVKSSLAQLKQVGKLSEIDTGVRTMKRLRFDAASKGGATVEVGAVQRKTLVMQKTLTTKKRAPEEAGDRTTKKLRFDDDGDEEETGAEETGTISGLPPKSPQHKKQRRMPTDMLDESQYWMAVDRFSHLS